MRKKLLVVLMTLILTVTAAAGMSITVNAAEGSGSSTYYYNLSKETSNTFSVGDVIFLTEVNTGVEDPDYLSYSWPSVLSAKVQVTSGMSAGNHYCNTALSGYASHYTVTVLQRSDNFDSCTQGCIYQGSGNQWYYSCNYGGVKNLTVYLYKCQTGSFTAGDVTFTWNPDGSISGAKIFEGTANEVTVPSYMIDIDDNTVDPSIGDYTRIAILGGVTAKAVDGSLAYEPYIQDLEGLSPAEKEVIKNELDLATSDAAVKQIISDAQTKSQNHLIAKENAKNDINAAVSSAKLQIDAMSNLSNEEKELKKQEIDNQAAITKTAIDTAYSDTLEEVLNNGLNAIDLVCDKAQAIDDINKSAADTKAYIDSLENLSNDEKTAMKDKVDSDAAASKSAITSATDTLGVEKATSDGLAAIQLDSVKAKAIDDINKSAADTKAYIDSLENLSNDEKIAMKDKVDSDAAASKSAINSATDTLGVEKATSDGLAAIQLDSAKAKATDDINKSAADTKAYIDSLENLSDDEKIAMKDKVDTNLTATLQKINDATVSDTLTPIVTDCITYNGIRAAESEAHDIVEGLTSLTDKEKENYFDIIEETVAAAFESIDATDTLANDYANILQGIEDTVISTLNDCTDDAIAEDFVKSYVADENGILYPTATRENIDQILSGKNDWDNLTETQRNKVNLLISNANKNIPGAPQSYEEYVLAGEEFATKSAEDFIKEYLTGADNNIYKYVTDLNYKQILSGKAVWDSLSNTEKETINKILAANGNDADNDTYPEMLAFTETIDKNVNEFIAKYLADENGNIHKYTTKENYLQILSGKADWDKLSETEQLAINALLAANGNDADNDTYPKMLAIAEAVEENANNFIAKYLTGDDGNIYKDATNENYLQILSGKAEWDKLSQLEKDAINEKLLANGGKTYEEMLKLAEELKELNSPQTSDAFSLQLWMLLVMLSGAILVLTRSRNKRFN